MIVSLSVTTLQYGNAVDIVFEEVRKKGVILGT
jgi:hypothetical protein